MVFTWHEHTCEMSSVVSVSEMYVRYSCTNMSIILNYDS